MLTSRNVIAVVITVAVVSLVAGCVTLFLTSPGSSVLGKDSYGTRAHGLRAVHDVLDELGMRVKRQLVPSLDGAANDATLVLWQPIDKLVQTEPKYFGVMADWVREGGRVVVAPSHNGDVAKLIRTNLPDDIKPTSVLAELGLPNVVIRPQKDTPLTEKLLAEQQTMDEGALNRANDYDTFRDAMSDFIDPQREPTRPTKIRGSGAYESLALQIGTIKIRAGRLQVIHTRQLEPSGAIHLDGDDREGTLIATYTVGRGEIVVCSEPNIIRNDYLASNDNGVLAVHLLTGGRPTVIFDEFYHGLTIRGNPLYLWTQRPYAAMTLAGLSVVGLLLWRMAIFLGPNRKEFVTSRRSITEYVEAMARLFMKPKSHCPFLLREIREGTLWSFRVKLGLQPGQGDAARVLSTLARRDPQQAQQLESALKELDSLLATGRTRDNDAVRTMKKVTDCLSS